MKKNLLIALILFAAQYSHAQWTVQNTGFSNPRVMWDLSVVDPSTAWAVTYDANGQSGASVTDLCNTIDGQDWQTLSISLAAASGLYYSCISAVSGDQAWVVMYNATGGGGLFRTQDGGFNWEQQNVGAFAAPNGFPDCIYMFNADSGWALGDPNGGYFEIYNTVDGGTNWNRVPQTDIPDPLSGEYGVTNSLSVVGNTIWFGTTMGRVFKSADMGYTWTAAETGLTFVPNLAFMNADTGIAYYNAGMKRTTDGGTTWNDVTYTGGFYGSDIGTIPGTTFLMSTGNPLFGAGVSGSGYSLDGGDTWVAIDDGVAHYGVGFYDQANGWTGGTDDGSGTGGMFHWTGIPLGVNPATNKDITFGMYPNPATDHFYIQLSNAGSQDLIVTVTNSIGQTVYENNFGNAHDFFARAININNWPGGTYNVTIKQGNVTTTRKLMVF